MREVRQDCRDAGLRPPSIKALRARVSARSLRERAAARDGAEAAGNRFRQVHGGLRTERPLQIVQIDHTKVDIMLVDDITRACIGRPWLTLVLDVHTRLVAGLYLSLDPPSAAGTGLAVAHAILPKTKWLADRGVTLAWPVHGIPELIHVTTDESSTRGRSPAAASSTGFGSRIARRPRRGSAATSSGSWGH